MRSAGLSIGPRGLHGGWNTRRGTYASAGLPGTGLYALHYAKNHATGEHQVRGQAHPVGCLLVLLLVAILAALLKTC